MIRAVSRFHKPRLLLVAIVASFVMLVIPARALAAGCTPTGGSFFGLPTWYEYVPGAIDESGKCRPDLAGPDGSVNLTSFLPVLLAFVDIALRIAGLAAMVYVIYGGYQYILSQGNPDGTTKARHTIINAFVGLVIALTAVGIVAFIGRTFQ